MLLQIISFLLLPLAMTFQKVAFRGLQFIMSHKNKQKQLEPPPPPSFRGIVAKKLSVQVGLYAGTLIHNYS